MVSNIEKASPLNETTSPFTKNTASTTSPERAIYHNERASPLVEPNTEKESPFTKNTESPTSPVRAIYHNIIHNQP